MFYGRRRRKSQIFALKQTFWKMMDTILVITNISLFLKLWFMEIKYPLVRLNISYYDKDRLIQLRSF